MATDLPPLTARQQSVLNHIRRTTADRGFPPSYREIGNGVGLSSVASVAHQAKELERKGYLHRAARRPRTVVLGKDAEPVLIGHDAIDAIANGGFCPDCHSESGIHVEIRDGAIAWDAVQTHELDCPRGPALPRETA